MNNEELACNWFSTEYGRLADGLDAQSHVFLNLARGLLQLSEGHDEIMAWYAKIKFVISMTIRSFPLLKIGYWIIRWTLYFISSSEAKQQNKT